MFLRHFKKLQDSEWWIFLPGTLQFQLIVISNLQLTTMSDTFLHVLSIAIPISGTDLLEFRRG